jgi:hypothetical protein
MLLLPSRRWVMLYALAAGPLLLLLHPLSFLPCFGLAALAWLTGGEEARLRRTWRGIGLWLLANALARLAWTATGLNEYERGRLEASSAINYLFPETLAQHLMLAAVVAGILLTAWALRMEPSAVTAHDRLARLTRGALALTLMAAIWVGAELLLGRGVVLKSAATFGVGLIAMAAFSWLVLRERGRRPPHPNGAMLGPLLCGVAILVLLLAKSSAWWTATRSLQNIVASSDVPCIPFGEDEPFGLQWPWMAIVDDWAAPFTALTTRAFVQRMDGQGSQPIALLLKDDRCGLLRETGEVMFTSWKRGPFEQVDRAFGPLRRP